MEGLGAAANVIAVIDLSAKVASLCLQYSRAVKNAKSSIQRLLNELGMLKVTLQGARQLLESPDGGRLQTSQRLRDGLSGCEIQLKELERQLDDTLNVGRWQKTMSRFGCRALKWPFGSKDVNDIIATFERQRNTLSMALIIDQTAEILNIGQKVVLSKLPTAPDATFDCYANGNDTGCLAGTRVDLLDDINKWAEDSQGECMFWLNGMAGTGKSTISRTVAGSFAADKEVLSASFFFKRGERDRGSARMLFTTIATQLVAKEPALAASIRDAIDADPALPNKALKDQFEHLIKKSLRSLEGKPTTPKRIILVIDALDECDKDDDVRAIISLLSQAKTLSLVQLRTFVTSRPELPIRLGFNTVKGQYQDLVLHEIPKPIIEHDIAVFLEYKFKEIRDEYNGLSVGDQQLPLNWPGTDAMQTLVQMAVPLFIFATTTCRFIKDDPASRLNEVLNYHSMTKHDESDQFDATYRPVLDRLIAGKKETAKISLVEEFRTVVGSIVLLAEPLSAASLADLLNVSPSVIDRRLTSLHSVLNVPASAKSPVRTFHLSFRDFLVDHDKRDTNPFWVDERATHGRIANRCLELLFSGNRLRKNICNFDVPGMARVDVDSVVINSHLPAGVRYACLYWVHHLEQSRPAEDKACITDYHQAYTFLKSHFLHWLEALGLLGKISESIAMIRCLQDLISSRNSAGITSFLRDASRFILNSRSIINLSPLQVYSSAMIFAPERSVIRNTFQKDIPDWISVLPKVDLEWGACRQTIEGHDDSVEAIAFSPDGKSVASGSHDTTVRLWDAVTGEERQKLEGHSNSVKAVAFSPDGKTVASGSHDTTVRLWDVVTGEERQKLEGHDDLVKAVAFSPDGKIVASGSHDTMVRLWDAATGRERWKLEGHDDSVKAVAFSPDGKIVASGSSDTTVRLWDAAKGKERRKLEGNGCSIKAVAFSPDGKIVASGSHDTTVRLWDAVTGEERQKLEGHDNSVTAVAFSPDGKTVASGSHDTTVRLWDAVNGEERQKLEGHTWAVQAVAFSPDGTTVASGSHDTTLRLWNTAVDEKRWKLEGHSYLVTAVAFSPDGKIVVSRSPDMTVRLWDAATGKKRQKLKGYNDSVETVAFSPDGKMVALCSDNNTVRLWNAATREERQNLKGHSDSVTAVAFSPDGNKVASGSRDTTVRLWDVVTGKERQNLKGHSDSVTAVAFSPDGNKVASGSRDTTVRLWDAVTGEERQKLKGYDNSVKTVAFSPDGKMVALCSDDNTVRLWDVVTGKERQNLKGHSDSITAVAFSLDGKKVASSSTDKTVRLWDATTGEEKQKLIFDHSYFKLSFSTDCRHLKTDRGTISLDLGSEETSSLLKTSGHPIIFGQDWVTYNGRRVLWFPPDLRPCRMAFHDNTFALGYYSGLVKIIRFTFS